MELKDRVIKSSLSEQIYGILRQDIVDGNIGFGSVLVNKNLQERFNVSSTPIRDAILRLKEAGLVGEVTKLGAKIIDFDSDYAREVNHLIIIITVGALENALKRKNTKLIKELKKQLKLQAENIDNNKYYEYDYRFHKIIFEYSNNSLLKDLFKKYNLVHQLLVRAYHNGEMDLEIRKRCIIDHENIVKFVEHGDIKGAISAARLHYYSADILFENYANKQKNN